ncbi:MAG: hypothetical protein ABTQ25_17740 [Nitrosomonas ureae]
MLALLLGFRPLRAGRCWLKKVTPDAARNDILTRLASEWAAAIPT